MCLRLFSNGFGSGPRCYIEHQPGMVPKLITKQNVLKLINITITCMDQTNRLKRKSNNYLKLAVLMVSGNES